MQITFASQIHRLLAPGNTNSGRLKLQSQRKLITESTIGL